MNKKILIISISFLTEFLNQPYGFCRDSLNFFWTHLYSLNFKLEEIVSKSSKNNGNYDFI